VVVVARLYTLSSSSFFLSFFKVILLLLLLSLSKKFPLFLFSAREREIDVCVFGMDGDEIFETTTDKKEEEEFFLWVFFFEE
jgi:hypothetical protein